MFLIAVGFLALSIYLIYKRLRTRKGIYETQIQSSPIGVIVFLLLLGMFLFITSIPGAFFEQPYWFTNKLYSLVEKVIEFFT